MCCDAELIFLMDPELSELLIYLLWISTAFVNSTGSSSWQSCLSLGGKKNTKPELITQCGFRLVLWTRVDSPSKKTLFLYMKTSKFCDLAWACSKQRAIWCWILSKGFFVGRSVKQQSYHGNPGWITHLGKYL